MESKLPVWPLQLCYIKQFLVSINNVNQNKFLYKKKKKKQHQGCNDLLAIILLRSPRLRQEHSLLCWKCNLLLSVKHYHVENDIFKIVSHQLWSSVLLPLRTDLLRVWVGFCPITLSFEQTSIPLIFPQFLYSFYILSSVPTPTHNGCAAKQRTLMFTGADTDICMWCRENKSESSLQALCHVKENCPAPLHEFRSYLTFSKCHYLTF